MSKYAQSKLDVLGLNWKVLMFSVSDQDQAFLLHKMPVGIVTWLIVPGGT